MLVKKFLTDPTIDHKGKALDVGFGNGNDSLSLARAGYVVEAIDKNKEQVEKFLKKTKGESIRVLEKDVCNLVLGEHMYSVIVASNVLFFIDNKEKVLELIDNFIEALCSRGYLLFSLLGPEDS